MKNLLTNNKIKYYPVFILFASFLFSASYVKALTSYEYYRNLFNSWKITTDFPEKNSNKTNLEKRYLLITTSQEPQENSINLMNSQYKNVIVICDTDVYSALTQPVLCTSSTIRNIDFSLINPDDNSTYETVVSALRPTVIDNKKYYFIPQILFLTPGYQAALSGYFTALSKADSVTIQNDQEKEVELLGKLTGSSVFQISIYILITTIFVLIFRKALIKVVRKPSIIIHTEIYVQVLKRIVYIIQTYFPLLSLAFLFLLLLYIPIFYALMVKGNAIDDSSYAVKYIQQTLNPMSFYEIIVNRDQTKIMFVLFNYILSILGIILILPSFAKFYLSSKNKINGLSIRSNFMKWIFPFMVITAILLLAFFDFESVQIYTIFTLLITLILVSYIKKRRIPYFNLFSRKERLFLTTLTAAALILNYLYPVFNEIQPVKYRSKSLIGNSNVVSLLPYSKVWEKNIIFESHYYNGNSLIFADRFLIYAPNTSKVINKTFKDFINKENFVIISTSSNETINAVLHNPKIIPYIEVDSSPLIYIDNTNSSINENKSLQAKVRVNCSTRALPVQLKLRVISLNSSDVIRAFNFPGCRNENGTESFTVPFDSNRLPRETAVLWLDSSNLEAISNLEVLSGNKSLTIKFLNKNILKDDNYSVLYLHKDNSGTIYSYSPVSGTNYSEDVIKDSRGADISSPINSLMTGNKLLNPFTIWSDQPGEVIQLPQ